MISNQLQRLQARVAVLADNEMVVHCDTERARDLHDRLRHLDVGARRRRITRGMVVQEQVTRTSVQILFDFCARTV
jgi:hypothetical protein